MTKTAAATGTGNYEAFSTGSSGPGGKKNSGAAAIDLGQSYSVGIVMAGLFAGFALLL